MNSWTTSLRHGLPLLFDGERFTVAEVDGRRVLLQQMGADGRPRWRQVDLSLLMTHPSTQFLVGTPEPEPTPATALGTLGTAETAELTERLRHVQEVRTGYRLGSAALALPGEPRPHYAPDVPKMRRYEAKARELGIDPATVRRWVKKVSEQGPVGLVGKRESSSIVDRVDPRWVDMARSVLAAHVDRSRPVRNLVLIEIEERLATEHGRGAVKIPGRTAGYALLKELTRGTNAFQGSTKGKRSIAERPQGVLGRLRATRPGEYVILDTTSLDVFAMEPVTCRWVRCELTVAMDLYSRCICGLRLTPVSTKSVDVAGVLYETVRSREPRGPSGEALPYCGVPSTVLVDADKLVDDEGERLLPSVAAETIVFDHGKVYISRHIESVCTKFGISLQPARPKTPTDKPVERWFRTLGEGLLAALPGYKGPDVYSRGLQVEEETFFFIDELEAVIREWINLVYHRRPHKGLVVPEVPGLELSPLEMFEHGVARSGPLRIPSRPDMAYDFLEEQWCTIQHYGVEINRLRYNGSGLDDLRNKISPHRGPRAGKWPVAIDRDDIRYVYFQHPDTLRWHRLDWEHAPVLNGPASLEALQYARRLALKTHRFPDTKRALVELLERWGAGLASDRTERRMAARLSQERFRIVGDGLVTDDDLLHLPTMSRLVALGEGPTAADQDTPGLPSPAPEADSHLGDDDEDDECDAPFPVDERNDPADPDDFYADILESR